MTSKLCSVFKSIFGSLILSLVMSPIVMASPQHEAACLQKNNGQACGLAAQDYFDGTHHVRQSIEKAKALAQRGCDFHDANACYVNGIIELKQGDVQRAIEKFLN